MQLRCVHLEDTIRANPEDVIESLTQEQLFMTQKRASEHRLECSVVDTAHGDDEAPTQNAASQATWR